MFFDNLSRAQWIYGTVVGTAIIAGGVVYVVRDETSLPAVPATEAPTQIVAPSNLAQLNPIPPRFQVVVNGKKRFPCDLTVNVTMSCLYGEAINFAVNQVEIARHADDPTRVAVNAYGEHRTGITWEELVAGVQIGKTLLRAEPASVEVPLAPVPKLFDVVINGGERFKCDLTVNSLRTCSNGKQLGFSVNKVEIMRHANDSTRLAVNAYGEQRLGVTWREMVDGVTVGKTTLQGVAR